MPSVVECVSAMSSGSATSTAATEARASAIRSEGQELVDRRAADRELPRRLLVHRALRLGGHRTAGAGVEVDAGTGRGQQRRIAATFSESGMNGETTPV